MMLALSPGHTACHYNPLFTLCPFSHTHDASLNQCKIGIVQRRALIALLPIHSPALQNPPRPLPRRVRLLKAMAHQRRQRIVRQAAGCSASGRFSAGSTSR